MLGWCYSNYRRVVGVVYGAVLEVALEPLWMRLYPQAFPHGDVGFLGYIVKFIIMIYNYDVLTSMAGSS